MQNSKEKQSNIKIKDQEELELDEILREIEEDERLQNVTVPEHVTRNIYAQIAAYQTAVEGIEPEEVTTAIVEELNEIAEETARVETTEEEQVVEKVTKITKKKRISRRSKKIYFLIAAVFILTMATGIVGVGTDYKWLQLGGKDLSENMVVEVDSEDDIMKITAVDEAEAFGYAKELFGVTPVMIGELPNGMQFESIEINGEVGITLQYSYVESVLYYTMIQNRNKTSHFEIQTGNLLDEYIIEQAEVEITVQEYIENNGSSSFKATFTHNNVFYGIKGVMEKDDFEEIIGNLHFFVN